MWTSVLIICPLLAVAENNIIFNNNGWVPVDAQTVFEQIKRQNAPIPDYLIPPNDNVLHADINELLIDKNAINIQDGPKIEDTEFDRNYNNDFEKQCIEGINCPTEEEYLKKKEHANENLMKSSKENVTKQLRRRSKKIDVKDKYFKTQNLFIPESNLIATERNTYQVNEDIEEENTESRGYVYSPPHDKKQSLLFEILSKYKIHKDDALPNYILSRKKGKSYTPVGKDFRNPFTQQRYNNQNHLLADPTLAVFLSNYGHYIQGMFGRNNEYNNLYGYLASNNIHNNRPLGIYKIFSDTDSSH